MLSIKQVCSQSYNLLTLPRDELPLMSFFTPRQDPPQAYKHCVRCGPSIRYDLEVEFKLVDGPRGEEGRWCCLPCDAHYQKKRAALAAASSSPNPSTGGSHGRLVPLVNGKSCIT